VELYSTTVVDIAAVDSAAVAVAVAADAAVAVAYEET